MLFKQKHIKYLYNLIDATYLSKSIYYKKEIVKHLDQLISITESEQEKIHKQITQKYYSMVFEAICNELSKKYNGFQRQDVEDITYLNCCGYTIDRNDLAAGSIYAFAYWVITDETAPALECTRINKRVNEIKDNVLSEFDRYL